MMVFLIKHIMAPPPPPPTPLIFFVTSLWRFYGNNILMSGSNTVKRWREKKKWKRCADFPDTLDFLTALFMKVNVSYEAEGKQSRKKKVSTSPVRSHKRPPRIV